MSTPQQTPQIYAVTDTNVLLDIHSCHDLTAAYGRAFATAGAAAVDDQSVVYRRARARESLLLAMLFNKINATTFSLHFELVDLLTRRAPPAGGGETMESDFTTVFLYFVKDYLLPDWNTIVPTAPGSEAKNEADRTYIAFAKERGLPLITNEGYGENGFVDEKMRKLAREEGVSVYAPREFYAGKINEADEIEAFLQRFKDQAPRYIDARKKLHGADDQGAGLLTWIYGYYRMILRGEVEHRSTPARLSVI